MNPRHELAVELFQLSRRWRNRLDERLRPHGLSKASWAVLYWVSQSPEGVSQVQLADQVSVETSTLTRQLDAMETQGLIERISVESDRRAKRVRLTEAARQRIAECAPIADAVRTEILGDISEEEIEVAVSVLRRAHARLG